MPKHQDAFQLRTAGTEDEVRAASLQFVRKLSGFNAPSQANRRAFDTAVEAVAQTAQQLLRSLTTQAKPRNREVEAAKARERAAKRFGKSSNAAA